MSDQQKQKRKKPKVTLLQIMGVLILLGVALVIVHH